MEQLPVHQLLPVLRDALEVRKRAVLTAPPGSGKTTVVPIELLDASWLKGRSILLLEPRRLAARAAAAHMAKLLGEEPGGRIGYRIRFDNRVSKRTRIEVLTEGILTRRLQRDPELRGVGLVIFDEFHERSLHADLALALTLDVAGGLREDLRLLVMSATMDTAPVARLLGDAPVIEGSGRSHPVSLEYLERDSGDDPVANLVPGVLRALEATHGDLLAFLPGAGEIRRAQGVLKERLGPETRICPLYGDLDSGAQDAAMQPGTDGRRRVVLATSIAETSLTIQGIHTVVDSGWSRLPRFNPNNGLTRLETQRVSRAAADQRAGRAGRLGPGRCYRLWSQAQQSRLVPFHPAEILETDLAALALELALWGVDTPSALQWLESPPQGSYAQARDLLRELEALDREGRITEMGRKMAAIGAHPRLAHMMIEGANRGQLDLAADLAALLTERDILRSSGAGSKSVDLEERLRLLSAWRKRDDQRGIESYGVDEKACRRVERSVGHWKRSLRGIASGQAAPLTPGALLSLAYPDRIAMRREGKRGGYLLASGRGLQLPEGESLHRHDHLVVPALDAGRREGRAFLAAVLGLQEIEQLHAGRLVAAERVAWDARRGAVMAREEQRLGALVLTSTPQSGGDPQALQQAMIDGIRQMGAEALPWTEALRSWLVRLQALRRWQPDQGWPDLSEALLMSTLEQWLAPWLEGVTRREQLHQIDLGGILRSALSWEQQRLMDDLAPTHLSVPSGSRRRLDYGSGEVPVLAVRLQEMFGLRDTPTVCAGQVRVMLHLLSPAQRPIQVTQDLAGFWDRTYQEVRRELKGRYPKHYWPDDPLTAVATARVRPK